MVDLPDFVAQYLETAVVATRLPAWLHIARDGALVDCGGPLGVYGIEVMAPGDRVAQIVPFLEGLLPLDDALTLPCVSMGTGFPADVHFIPSTDGDWVLLLDASSDAILRGLVQQRSNDLNLLKARHAALDVRAPAMRDVPSTLAAVLGALVIEEERDGLLVAIGKPPLWIERYMCFETPPSGADVVSRFAFLEAFLVDARDFWDGGEGTVLEGGTWDETDDEGIDASLDATAVHVDGRRFLVVRHVDESRDERRRVIQRAREVSLDLDRLKKDAQQREVLFHCIVHDLTGPLTSIKAIFSVLERESLPPTMTRLVEIGARQTSRQEELIREMLAVFAAERRVFDRASFDPATAPDAVACARTVVDALAPAAQSKGVDLEIEPELAADGPGLRVIGDRLQLERVISNLVENAIRHSPAESRITVRLKADASEVRIEVDDEGSGVTEDVAPSIFRRLTQGRGERGKAGLGLYFVRITVERWGGRVGFEARPAGGTRFWLTLPKV